MTEKRFEIKIGEFEEENIVDNLNKKTIREISDMCKKMNELNDENQQLKNDCSILVQSNQEYRKENEQLKEENKELKYHLNRTEKELKEYKDFMGLG